MKQILFILLILSFTVNSSAFFGNIFGRIFPKNKCPIKLYNPKDSSFTGVKLYTNAKTFHPILQTLSLYAKECRVKIHVKQAFIQEKPAMTDIILRDRSAMSFRLGEAIEFELVDQDKKLLCNRLCMERGLSCLAGVPDAKCFFQKLAQDSDIQRDVIKPTLLMKRMDQNQSFAILQDKRKELQNRCKKRKTN